MATSSAENIKTLEAKCHCGSVHFTHDVPVSSLPLQVHMCHCSLCRHNTGAPCVFYTPLAPGVKPKFVAPSSEANIQAYVSTSGASWTFCQTCGCHVAYVYPNNGKWALSSSIFTDHGSENFRIYKHVYSKSTKDGGIAAMLTHMGGRELLDWNPPDDDPSAAIEESPPEFDQNGEERLRAQCRCGGVSFSFGRPNQEALNDDFLKDFVSPLDNKKWLATWDICNDCRRVDGTHVIGWTFIPLSFCEPGIKSDLKIGTIKTYSSSTGVTRAFCGTCGATVFYGADERRPSERQEIIDVATGILRAPSGSMAEDWLTWRSRLAHYESGTEYDREFAEALDEDYNSDNDPGNARPSPKAAAAAALVDAATSGRVACSKPRQMQHQRNATRRPATLIAKFITAASASAPWSPFLTFRTMASSSRSYNEAVDALNSLQTPYAVLEARRKAGIKPNGSSVNAMREYLTRIGHTPADLARLNVVHVAGTKGKGSTCAFVDSILAQYQRTHAVPRKTGLFISPHLISVRERIRINSRPITEELFARYFFEVWDLLGSAAEQHKAEDDAGAFEPRPAYARYLTLMSWHVFLREGIDVAVYETGIGGEFDATNVVEAPAATGISTLGIDHVFILGETVDKIAWHKAGIMKPGSPAFTIKQVPEAAQVLVDRGREKGVNLKVLDIDPRLSGVRIRPNEDFQKKNATLAIALTEVALQKLDISVPSDTTLPQEFVQGLEDVVFRGRCEVKAEDKLVWYIDGAHTADSLRVSTKWFIGETAQAAGPRILIFNQQSRSEAVDFLEQIYNATKRAGTAFDCVLFCTNVTWARAGYKRDLVNRQVDSADIEKMTLQRKFADKWSSMDPSARVEAIPTIEDALEIARGVAAGLGEGETAHVLVTGSLHLVGGALGVLEKADAL
ncbi:Folylpolyglutamate synthase [Paramyrothecium foliicola]|nr:Folylpolyglutamate synthase [Paramyrothecium foliicola]